MPTRYTLEALESESGVPARTIKEWIRKNVLTRPLGIGRASYYSEHHVAAARVVRHMRAAGAPLAVIRQRIHGQTVDELKALVPSSAGGDDSASRLADGANEEHAGVAAPRQVLQAMEVMEGLTLLVNADREGARRVAEEICRRYGGMG